MLFTPLHLSLPIILALFLAHRAETPASGDANVTTFASLQAQPAGNNDVARPTSHTDPKTLFAQGQAALQSGDLHEAEISFRAVITADPRAGSAYANLGVIAMRRKEWDPALTLLQKAAALEPKMSGIRLNIGLVQFRRANYAAAIAPLSSVLRDQPDSRQARYLLGLCQVFTEHYADAVTTLEPLWSQQSADVMYLYTLDIAAQNSGRHELDEKVLARMIQIGSNTAEYHLILAKAYLNREETDKAIAELDLASAANPRVPFLHFNLGLAYGRAGDDARAESEFLQDVAIEPDLPDNYEQLGLIYLRTQRDADAEKSFHETLRLDPKSSSAFLGLARLYLRQQKYPQAVAAANSVLRVVPNSQSAHFMRGQALIHLGRREEGRKELAASQKILDSALDKDRARLGDNRIPNPELAHQPE
jgi:tetratricopeptide (TPR) repeat protein